MADTAIAGAGWRAASGPAAARGSRFVGFDGLRGVAAIVVVLGHSFGINQFDLALRHYLAVDFFFLLSGFVLAHAYDGPLRDGSLTTMAFVRNRLLRLHPLVVLAAAIPAATHTIGALAGVVQGPDLHVYQASLLGMLSLPYTGYGIGGPAYPLNVSQWSLLAEYLVNLLFVLLAPWLGWRLLLALIAGGAASLVGIMLSTGSLNHGADFINFEFGLARTIFPFFLGVALARLHRSGRLSAVNLPWPAQAALLMLPMLAPHTPLDPVLELAAVLFLFPIVILAGRVDSFPSAGGRLMEWMGAISYPLYILHWPIVRLVHRFAPPELGSAEACLVVAVQLILSVVAAQLALTLFDKPVQDLLRGRRRLPSFIPRFSHAANP